MSWHLHDEIVELLIAYWQGAGPTDLSIRNTCRLLTDMIIHHLPAELSEAIRQNPQSHVTEIRDALTSLEQSDPIAREYLRSLSGGLQPTTTQQVSVVGDHSQVITAGRDISGLVIQQAPTTERPSEVKEGAQVAPPSHRESATSSEPPSTPGRREHGRGGTMMWDVFISHAWEDKETIARPLAEALQQAGLEVWYDEFTLTLGDSLRRSIDRGLSESRYGVVILSPHFFAKEWPQRELDGLTAREVSSGKTVLPVWHNVTRQEVERFSPILADRLGVPTTRGLDAVIQEILRVLRPGAASVPGAVPPPQAPTPARDNAD